MGFLSFKQQHERTGGLTDYSKNNKYHKQLSTISILLNKQSMDDFIERLFRETRYAHFM